MMKCATGLDISEKSGITNSINHNFARIRFDSYNSFTYRKIIEFS